jgi:hypothetical protein
MKEKNGMSFGVIDGQTDLSSTKSTKQFATWNVRRKSKMIDKSFEKKRSTTATTSSFSLNIPHDDFNSSPLLDMMERVM